MLDSETPKTVDSASTAPSTPQVKLSQCTAVRTGLRNLGRTCYANCVLQTLYANDGLRRLVMSYHPPSFLESGELDNTPSSVNSQSPTSGARSPTSLNSPLRQKVDAARTLVALQELFALMRFGPWPVVSPRNVLSCFIQACKARPYDFATQEDPNEFMTHFLSVLSKGFSLGSCHLISYLNIESLGDRSYPLSLRDPSAHLGTVIMSGADASRLFNEIITGESVSLMLEDQGVLTSISTFDRPCTSHLLECPIFGGQAVTEPAMRLCSLLMKDENAKWATTGVQDATLDLCADSLQSTPSDWRVVKVLGLAEDQEARGEVFREIHLANEIFNNLTDALVDYQFPESTTSGLQQEWWTLRTPRIWHFTLHRSMWSDDQAWKSSRAFRMPPEISVGHLCIQNRSRVLRSLYRARDRINALKRLSVWHTGFPVSPREHIDHEAIFKLGQEAAKSLEEEVPQKDQLIAEKLVRYLKLAQQQYKGIKEKVLDKRRRLLLETPNLTEGPRLRLSSVWIHDGNSSGHGHFWCLLRQGNTWFKLNDDKVQIPSEREIEEILSPQGLTAAHCLYSALYEDIAAVKLAADEILRSKTFIETKYMLTPAEAMEYYEFFSLPDSVRASLCATASAESDWAVKVQAATLMRSLAAQYLDELVAAMYKTHSIMNGYEHLQTLFEAYQIENAQVMPIRCAEVVETLKHMQLRWLVENRLLWLWATLISTVCLRDPSYSLIAPRLGVWVCRAYASELFKQLLIQHPQSDSECLQAAILSLILERNHICLNSLLGENEESIFLPNLEVCDRLCSPYSVPETIQIAWDNLTNKHIHFLEHHERLQRALMLVESEDIDVGYCQLVLLLVSVECVFLREFIQMNLFPLQVSWMEVLRGATPDLLLRGMKPEFLILLKALVPAGYVLQAFAGGALGGDSYKLSETILLSLLDGVYKRDFLDLQKAILLLHSSIDWKNEDILPAVETCKQYVVACCSPLANWTRKGNAGVCSPSVFQRMVNAYQQKVQ